MNPPGVYTRATNRKRNVPGNGEKMVEERKRKKKGGKKKVLENKTKSPSVFAKRRIKKKRKEKTSATEIFSRILKDKSPRCGEQLIFSQPKRISLHRISRLKYEGRIF